MILTTCAACAAPLAHTAPRCVRCHTRYCNKTCQHDHWRRGHKQMCKKIHRGGNAEQYHADKKYKEAVAVAVEACADDTKGQTCYICTQALHWKTKEGLVRGCSCRGTAGFAHVSCLAEQAKILCDEAEENNLMNTDRGCERWRRWDTCNLCKQRYHGVVKYALGWACWKTYLGRPEGDRFRIWAMGTLGQSMRMVGHVREATVVLEALLALIDRQPEKEKHTHTVLNVQNTLASLYGQQGRHEEELSLRRKNYPLLKLIEGANSQNALISANNLGLCLHQRGRHAAAREALREPLADARRTFGEDHSITLNLRETTADATSGLGGEANLRETIAIYEDLVTRSRRVLGTSHPTTQQREQCLREFRAFLTGGVAAVLAERRARGGGGGA
ncbi:unnamed protein product [Pelagomonas calceolata]|uniref:MYND-type domain-containing protein n=2 Tax=Pelagomonas calceolata TaxID=35677 RepID=A0A8J2SIX5_9STRA|nr:unnamed protein product [Pelagomonas calceolata]